MTSFNPLRSNAWLREFAGIGVAIGISAFGAVAAMVSALGADNSEAARTEAATRVVRTDEWLRARKLDPSSSVDMMRALILACNEIKARGERC